MKVFKTRIEKAIYEPWKNYTVALDGTLDNKPIYIEIEVNSKDEIP